MNKKELIIAYLLEELQLDISKEDLKGDTPLLSTGVLDSISALQLVDFLEKTFNFEFEGSRS